MLRILCENIVFVLGSYDHFLSFSHLFPSVVTMSPSAPSGGRRVNNGRRLKGTVRTITMKLWHSLGTTTWCLMRRIRSQKKLTDAPGNAILDPSTMRVKKMYQESIREDDDSRFSLPAAVSDIFSWNDHDVIPKTRAYRR